VHFDLKLEDIYLSIYLYLSGKHKIHNMSITYSGRDSETTMILNTALTTYNNKTQ